MKPNIIGRSLSEQIEELFLSIENKNTIKKNHLIFSAFLSNKNKPKEEVIDAVFADLFPDHDWSD